MPAPLLETPPNPIEPPSTPPAAKVRTGRFGELEEHELIHLLDTLDDERASARFRESIYISLFVYIVIGWFLFYGPRVLFHQPRLVNPSEVLKQRELTNLQLPADIAKALEHAPRAKPTPAVKPQIDQKTLEAMRRAAPVPKALPATPQPQPSVIRPPVQQSQPAPLPPVQPAPRPAPPVLATIPDAPKPTPNFGNQTTTAGDSIRQAVEGAARNRGGGGAEYGRGGATRSPAGLGGAEILSDTMGVNFDPYLKRILREIYDVWIPQLPQEAYPPLNKQGVTQLRFIILPDGKIGGIVLEGSTHDDALNRAAWGSITGVGQFPALPAEFHGPNLTLRIHYLVNQKQE